MYGVVEDKSSSEETQGQMGETNLLDWESDGLRHRNIGNTKLTKPLNSSGMEMLCTPTKPGLDSRRHDHDISEDEVFFGRVPTAKKRSLRRGTMSEEEFYASLNQGMKLKNHDADDSGCPDISLLDSPQILNSSSIPLDRNIPNQQRNIILKTVNRGCEDDLESRKIPWNIYFLSGVTLVVVLAACGFGLMLTLKHVDGNVPLDQSFNNGKYRSIQYAKEKIENAEFIETGKIDETAMDTKKDVADYVGTDPEKYSPSEHNFRILSDKLKINIAENNPNEESIRIKGDEKTIKKAFLRVKRGEEPKEDEAF